MGARAAPGKLPMENEILRQCKTKKISDEAVMMPSSTALHICIHAIKLNG